MTRQSVRKTDYDREALLAFWGLPVAAALVMLAVAAGLVHAGLSPRQGICWGALTCTRTLERFLALSVFLMMALGMSFGAASFLRRLGATQKLMQAALQNRTTAGGDLRDLARECDLEGRVLLVRHVAPFAFTGGWLHPVVVLSTTLCDALSRDELRAILWHEKYHVLRRDPLKVLLATSITDGFFYAPLVAEVTRWYESAKELAADAWAVAHMGTELGLAGALVKLARRQPLRGLTWGWGYAVAGGLGMGYMRMTRLLQPDLPLPRGRWPARAILMTTIAAGYVMAALLGRCH